LSAFDADALDFCVSWPR